MATDEKSQWSDDDFYETLYYTDDRCSQLATSEKTTTKPETVNEEKEQILAKNESKPATIIETHSEEIHVTKPQEASCSTDEDDIPLSKLQETLENVPLSMLHQQHEEIPISTLKTFSYSEDKTETENQDKPGTIPYQPDMVNSSVHIPNKHCWRTEHKSYTSTQLSSESELDDSDADKSYIPSEMSECSDLDIEVINIEKRRQKWWRKRNRPKSKRVILPKRRGSRGDSNRETAKKLKKSSLKSDIQSFKNSETERHGKYCRKLDKSDPIHHSALASSHIRHQTETNESHTSELHSIMEKSKKIFQVNELLRKHHEGRLNNLLTSNNLCRVSITADGNCFFNAIKHQLKIEDDIASMRNKLSNHMLDNETHYICFMTQKYNIREDEASSLYKDKINEIREDGLWNMEMSDLIPLATANMFHRQIKIYSSIITNPVIDIVPDIEGTESSTEPLLLAYLAVRGFEHYDACKKVSQVQSQTIKEQQAYPPNAEPVVHTSPEKCSTGTNVMTPRKSANYLSPQKKKHSRKRQVNKDKWKKTVRKEQKLKGERYFSPTTQKPVAAKILKERDCSSCKYLCSKNIPEDTRKHIFQQYYDVKMTYERKRDFICRHVIVTNTGKRNKKTYKLNARSYYLPSEGNLIRVCKQFFLSTLAISDKMVRYTLGRKKHGSFSGKDMRGRHIPGNKVSDSKVYFVRKHIESFPVVESHYQRQGTKRKFLGQELSVNKMFDLYKEKCKEAGQEPVKASKYREVFCNEYNLSFYHPKKDTCEFCNLYNEKEGAGTLTEELKNNYLQHMNRNETARREKVKDKEMSKKDKSVYVATFDLQSVLYTPCSKVSKAYYKRKLNCYNLSMFSLGDKTASCYMWDETQGQRGSSEIGSCVITHIRCLPSTIRHVILYSDCCSGQNRNKYLAAGLLHTVNTHQTVETIEQKFLESGHTQMECDSMHSAIEHAKKGTAIFIPDQWDTVIHMARRKKPYTVIPMRYDSFYDLTEYTNSHCSGFKVDINGRKINWLKLKVLRVSKSAPDQIHVKESFDEESFRIIQCVKVTRGRQQNQQTILKPKYSEKRPISESKKKDLISLCDSLVIPETYHYFYKAIKTDTSVKDEAAFLEFTDEDE